MTQTFTAQIPGFGKVYHESPHEVIKAVSAYPPSDTIVSFIWDETNPMDIRVHGAVMWKPGGGTTFYCLRLDE